IQKLLREACGGRALARCEAQRSTEAKRSPQHADPSVARDTPKKIKNQSLFPEDRFYFDMLTANKHNLH
ncbi:MAG: hypothetical protein NZ455_15480, partial [Bacteroidia bacterium]|nr:hypothetical protein [Bacteroidia bacterium]